jgi:hypothetical protein
VAAVTSSVPYRASSGLAMTLYAANPIGAPRMRSGPLTVSAPMRSPAPRTTTTATPVNASARPARRAPVTRSSPSAAAKPSVMAGAVATISAAVPEVVHCSPRFSVR